MSDATLSEIPADPSVPPPGPDECDVIEVTVTALSTALGEDAVEGKGPDGTSYALPRSELGAEVSVGDRFEVFLERSSDRPNTLVGSRRKAEKLALWRRLEELAEGQGELEGEVIATVKGGLSVDVGVRGFVPASQADLRQPSDLSGLVGQRLTFQVVKFDRKRGAPVLSRRPILERERAALKEQTLARLKEGEVLTGVVRNFTSFGAFVDVGGIDGLIHTSDLSWGRVERPSQVLEIGQEVRVKVLSFDAERERLSLGYRQLLPNPWETVGERYPEGARRAGRVVGLSDYGAFVELEPGVEGLVHVSEMSWAERVRRPEQVVSLGDEVEVVILSVDAAQQRIALGLKQAQPNPWVAFAAAHPVGSVIRGTVSGIKDFGVFVRTEEGLEGLVHVSDLSWERQVDPSEVAAKGDTLEVKVLDVDVEAARLSLGIKQLTEDPWKELSERTPPGTKIQGKVTRVEPYGVFVEVEPGIEGLCHVSQLSTERVERPSDVAKVGDQLEVAVVDVDRKRRRVQLSVRALHEVGDDYRQYMVDDDQGFGNVLAQKLASLAKD